MFWLRISCIHIVVVCIEIKRPLCLGYLDHPIMEFDGEDDEEEDNIHGEERG